MAANPVPQANVDAVADAYRQSFSVAMVARQFGISESTVSRYLDKASIPRNGGHASLGAPFHLLPSAVAPMSGNQSFTISAGDLPPLMREPPAPLEPPPFAIPFPPPIATSAMPAVELVSRADNTYCFGAFGDLHAASKYARYEVRADLHRRALLDGAQCIFDTGNWIDGEASFNRYDLEAVGLDAQLQILAQRYPNDGLRTYAVTGRDHEGWYVTREGLDVGRYCESIMNEAGHDWIDLGYMQADVILRNANTGKATTMRIMHPGGGTGYALSYRPQKIIESMEGGEKPAVLLLGHYHKIDAGLVRNVWYVQTGCGQDQTPFMAQKSIEAHVGGVIVQMEQDPETGAIVRFRPDLNRYFNRRYYFDRGANNRWSEHGPVTPAPRSANTLH